MNVKGQTPAKIEYENINKNCKYQVPDNTVTWDGLDENVQNSKTEHPNAREKTNR